MAKDRDSTIRGGPGMADAALPPEATSGRRADPSVGRIRLLSLPSSAPLRPASARRTSVRSGPGQALGQPAHVLEPEVIGEHERERMDRRAALSAQPREPRLLG